MDQDSKPIVCPICGGEIPPDSAAGWCPRCALSQLLKDDATNLPTSVLSLRDIPQPGESVTYIGDYELLDVIAHGGMGVVYRARQRSLNRIVALKLLLGGAHASEDFKRRFRQEAAMAAKLQHPNIVPIYEVGEHGGQPFFSMEFVAGSTLAELTRNQPLPPKKAAECVQVVAEAIAYAHTQGVLHRDLKPSNILVGLDDRPRVSDFGLARQLNAESSLTLSGEVLGTPGYLPPEQASTHSGTIGPPSDVYALGAILYHLLTGRPPFMAGTLADVLQQVLKSEPVSLRRLNPAVPKDLETITLKCIEKDQSRRYAGAGELAADIERYLRNEPILARAPSRIYKFQKLFGRNKLAFIGGSALAASLLIGITVSTSLFFQEKDARLKATKAERSAEQEQHKANAEAAKSKQVADFLQSIFRGVQPQVAMGRDTAMLRDILDQAAKQVEADLKGQPEAQIELQATLAETYQALELNKEAAALLEKALILAKAEHGDNSLVSARLISSLAVAVRELGDVARAESLVRKGLTIRQNLLGPDQKEVADSLQKLAIILQYQSKLEEAELRGREALALVRKLYVNDTFEQADALSSLSGILSDADKSEEAEKLQREAVELVRKKMGEDHPVMARHLNDLAALLGNRGKHAEAEVLLRQALEIAKRRSGNDSAPTALCLVNLALQIQWQNRLDEAESLLREALAIRQALFGEDHPEVLRTRKFLGGVLTGKGKFDEAESLQRQALATAKKLQVPAKELADTYSQLIYALPLARRTQELEKIFIDLAIPDYEVPTEFATLVGLRARMEARVMKWNDATRHMEAALRANPADFSVWYSAMVLKARNGDLGGYRDICRAALRRFSGPQFSNFGRSLAKGCLLAPIDASDLTVAGRLMDQAFRRDSSSQWMILDKSLADFRMGQFSNAVSLLRQVVPYEEGDPNFAAQSTLVRAICQFQLGLSAEARESFDHGVGLVSSNILSRPTVHLGRLWEDYVIARLLMVEACGLIDPRRALPDWPTLAPMDVAQTTDGAEDDLDSGGFDRSPRAGRGDNQITTNPASVMVQTENGKRFVSGFLALELYTDIYGTSVSSLTNHPAFKKFPNRIQRISSFEIEGELGVNSGVRLYGYLTPPVTGKYVFYLAGDDSAEIYLSSDEAPQHKRLIAFLSDHSKERRSWMTETLVGPVPRPPERSEPIYLEAGLRYYVEGLLKQAGGPGFIGLAWQIPGAPPPKPGDRPIASKYLSYQEGPSIVAQPKSVTINEGEVARFQIGLSSPSFSSVTWTRNGKAIVTNGLSQYETPRLRRADNGVKYRTLLRSSTEPGIIASDEAVVTIIPDTKPPELLSAVNFSSSNTIYLMFNERLDAAVTNDSISFKTTAGEITNVSLGPEQKFVALELRAITNLNYDVIVSGIRDWAGNEASGTTRVAGQVADLVPYNFSQGVDGAPLERFCIPCATNEFDMIVEGGVLPLNTDADDFLFTCRPVNGDFDVAVLLARQDAVAYYAAAGLMARASLSPKSPYVNLTAAPTEGNKWCGMRVLIGENDKRSSQALPNIPRDRVYPAKTPNEWQRIRRAGRTFTTFRSINGQTWRKLWSVDVELPENMYVGLMAHSDHNTNAGYVSFRHFTLNQPERGSRWSAEEAQPSGKWTNSLGMIFVNVPETQARFSIWDTRVQDFEQFTKQTGYRVADGMESLGADGWKDRGHNWQNPGFPQGPTHPVVGVSPSDADAFCRWLTEKERQAGNISSNALYRLPENEEWEIAREEIKFPWGDAWPPPPGSANLAGEEANDENWLTNRAIIKGYNDGFPRTSPVDAFPANRFGLHDMAGNAFQWERGHDEANGGCWYDVNAQNSRHWNSRGKLRSSGVGFRCVLETPIAIPISVPRPKTKQKP